jgi:phosphate:Na+ symporter
MSLSLLYLIGGVGLLLYGISIASDSLQDLTGRHLKLWIYKINNRPWKAILIGFAVTVLFQSSSASSVLFVNLAQASVLNLAQAIAMLLGAGIGSTLTVQILALRLQDYAILIVGLAALLYVLAKSKKTRRVCRIFFGLGMVFLSLQWMGEAITELRKGNTFELLLSQLMGNRLGLFFFALILTALLHSSAATVGIALVFAQNGTMGLLDTVPIILGANLGTSVTGIMGSIGKGEQAKQVGVANVILKAVGVALFIPIAPWLCRVLGEILADPAWQVAWLHTLFNALLALAFLPLTGLLGALLQKLWVTPIPTAAPNSLFLEKGFLETPGIALGQATRGILRIADWVTEMVNNVMQAFDSHDENLMRAVVEREMAVDRWHADITAYLTRLHPDRLTDEEQEKQLQLLYVVKDLEHIGDIVYKDLRKLARKKIEQQLTFSAAGTEELRKMQRAVFGNLTSAINAFASNDTVLAQRVLAQDDGMETLEQGLRLAHITRLQGGVKASVQTSSIHLDVINCLKRIHTHALSIARTLNN